MNPLGIDQAAADSLRREMYPTITRGCALAYLRELAETARHRPRGRRWTRTADVPVGAQLLISASEPDVCLVVERGRVVDLLVRSSAQPLQAEDATPRTGPDEMLRRRQARRAAELRRAHRLARSERRAGSTRRATTER